MFEQQSDISEAGTRGRREPRWPITTLAFERSGVDMVKIAAAGQYRAVVGWKLRGQMTGQRTEMCAQPKRGFLPVCEGRNSQQRCYRPVKSSTTGCLIPVHRSKCPPVSC
jgi:hypothetical protein